jgi:hypothetical protein
MGQWTYLFRPTYLEREGIMMNKVILTVATVCAVTTLSGIVFAQQAPTVIYEQPAPVIYQQAPVVYMQAPVVNIGNRHGNLRSAQTYIVDAYQKIETAQRDNDGQLGGHAQRAKELLIQADAELRQAANVANAEGR